MPAIPPTAAGSSSGVDRRGLGTVSALCSGLMPELAGVYNRYTDDELATILDWLVGAADAQRKATAALAEPERPAGRSRR